MLDSLMQNAVIWLVLSLCTIGSMVWGIYTWWANKRRKEISYEFETTEVIRARKCFSGKLDIRFDGKPISDLSITKFFIWNSGTEIINREDIVASRPLAIRGNKRATLLEADVMYANEATNEFMVEKLSDEAVILSFDYVAKRQGIALQVLHTGSIKDLLVDCTIKGGEKVKNPSNQTQYTTCQKLLRIVFSVYQNICVYIGLFISVPIVEQIDKLVFNKASKVTLAILIMSGFALISVLLSRWLRKLIRNHNPHIVPPSLKNVHIAIPVKICNNYYHNIHTKDFIIKKTPRE